MKHCWPLAALVLCAAPTLAFSQVDPNTNAAQCRSHVSRILIRPHLKAGGPSPSGGNWVLRDRQDPAWRFCVDRMEENDRLLSTGAGGVPVP